MPFTYIIYSTKLDKYYVGACTDLERRLYEHITGLSNYLYLLTDDPMQAFYFHFSGRILTLKSNNK